MSELKIYADDNPQQAQAYTDYDAISGLLQAQGVRFERWQANAPLTDVSTQGEVIAAYRADIDRLMAENGFQSVDVVSLTPAHPDKLALRQKFLNEHTHSEFEVRFFVDGQGLFYLHIGDKVYTVLCEKGDLISVPAGVPHWFDMGENPHFRAIRLFTNPDGWVANFTGNDIAERFPRLEN
ncbi:1,2-dihydroxy-3-keto-5-methylthiopentene dioxygenase [Thiothrix nivea]|uniref:Acireductone dioxygenase n=1 Tax=Thiothrix nivea (strain ATCC 35100 / DSM 5205 / JP2) TaxID=870187 RepID=A0A656HCJ4_THINJ|nr:acireductone dioxygenase [Thiothrix nivea]EIJ34598.1 acireductone dioxygenase apoprotein [Thiothrix nivea DSM 5205]